MRVEKTTTATTSALVICCFTNLSAASCARIRSSVCIEVRSKNSTMRRRSRRASLIASAEGEFGPSLSTDTTMGLVSSAVAVSIASMSA